MGAPVKGAMGRGRGAASGSGANVDVLVVNVDVLVDRRVLTQIITHLGAPSGVVAAWSSMLRQLR
eukprot:5868726-Alexandrium_andersonii.AAC.1